MFDNTKPHNDVVNDKHTIKVGTNVPTGAVNLGYFNNAVNSNAVNAAITNAPVDTINHITVDKEIIKQCIPKDESLFPNTVFYNDADGYFGNIPLQDIKWYPHKHTFNEEYSISKVYEVDKKEIPQRELYYEFTNKDGVLLTGTLKACSVDFIPIEYEQKTDENFKGMKNIRKTLRTEVINDSSYTFQDTIQYDDGEYIGILKKVQNSQRALPIYPNCKAEWVSHTEINGGDTCSYGGYTLPRLKTESSEITINSYGWCRYWGPTLDGTYYDGSGIKFTDAYPRVPSESSYFLPNQIKSPQKPAYVSSWIPNASLATNFGGNGSTNWVWATNVDQSRLDSVMGRTMSELANIVGCSTIEPDILFGQPVYYDQISIVDNPGTIGPSNAEGMKYLYSHIFREIPGHSCCNIESGLANYVLNRGSISDTSNVYFRDCIGFYTLNATINKGYYGKMVVDEGNCQYKHECDYEGIVYKKISNTKQVGSKWKAIVRYIGQLTGGYVDYNGIATYTGVVNKKNLLSVLDNYNDNVYTMYSMEDGTLVKDINDTNTSILESEMFYVTNMYKDKEPLFYCCKLINNVYITKNIDSALVYTGDEIKLIDKHGHNIFSNFKYQIKLEETSTNNVYKAYIYTNFTTSINTDFYCLYNAYIEGNIVPNTKEKIYVHPCMYRGKDYNVENQNIIERKNIIKVTSPLIFDDNRNKLEIEYCIKAFKDNNIVKTSDPFTIKCINKDYALKEELYNFEDNNNIISYCNNTEVSVKTLLNLTNSGLSNTEILCDDNNITYAGSWNKSNTDYYTSNIIGDKIQFSFTGTGIELYFVKDSHSGSVNVLIDEKSYNIPLYAENPTYEKCLDIKDLSNETHNVTITVTDYINVDSLDYNVNFSKALSYTPFDFNDDSIIYKAELTGSNKNIDIANYVNLFTNPNGNSNISVEVFIPTGIINGVLYDEKILLNIPYKEVNNKIYCQYSVKLIDNRSMVLGSNRDTDLLKDWNILIKMACVSKIFSYRGIKTKYVYNLPEYNTQDYSVTYGRPYIDIKKEKAQYINDNLIKVKLYPLHLDFNENNIVNLHVYLNNDNIMKELSVYNAVFQDGLILLNDSISENDNILVDYTYVENYYTYRGSYTNNVFNPLDINTNFYHRYGTNDNEGYYINQGNTLLDKTIYVFAKPTVVIFDYSNDSSVIDTIQKTTYLTSSTKDFPSTVHISENGYEGDIPKSGDCFVISGEESKTYVKPYTKEITYINLGDIKDSIYVEDDGYSGTISKNKDYEKVVVENTVLSKDVEVTNKYYDDDDINKSSYYYSDENGYKGDIPLISSNKEYLGMKEDKVVDTELIPLTNIVKNKIYTNNEYKDLKEASNISLYKDNVYEKYASGLVYSSSDWQYDNSTYCYSTVENATLKFSFLGNGFEIYGIKAPYNGIFKITIDNVDISTIDTYRDEYVELRLYKSSLLSYSAHNVIITVLGTKNTSSTSTQIGISKIIINNGILVSENASNSYEDTDAGLVFSDYNWTTLYSEKYSGGSLKLTQAENATLKFSFIGKGFELYGTKATTRGFFKVNIDGSDVATIDAYNNSTLYTQLLYKSSLFSFDIHDVIITVLNTKNTAATSIGLDIDKVVINNGILNSNGNTSPYEEDNEFIQYSGNWTVDTVSSNSGSSAKYSNTQGDYCSFVLNGSGFEWYGLSNQYKGIANIYIDNELITSVDTYSSSTQYCKMFYKNDSLEKKHHIVKIEVSGNKNSNAIGGYINIDKICVINGILISNEFKHNNSIYNSDLQFGTPYKINVDNHDLKLYSKYTSGWSFSTTSERDYDNSIVYPAYSTTKDDVIEFNLLGNVIELHYYVGPDGGKMKIYLADSKVTLIPICFEIECYNSTVDRKKIILPRRGINEQYIKIINGGAYGGYTGTKIGVFSVKGKDLHNSVQYGHNNYSRFYYSLTGYNSIRNSQYDYNDLSPSLWKQQNITYNGTMYNCITNTIKGAYLKSYIHGDSFDIVGKVGSNCGTFAITVYTIGKEVIEYCDIINCYNDTEKVDIIKTIKLNNDYVYNVVVQPIVGNIFLYEFKVKNTSSEHKSDTADYSSLGIGNDNKTMTFLDSRVVQTPSDSWNVTNTFTETPNVIEYYLENKTLDTKLSFDIVGDFLEIKAKQGNNCGLQVTLYKDDNIYYTEKITDTNKIIVFYKTFEYGKYHVIIKPFETKFKTIKLTDVFSGPGITVYQYEGCINNSVLHFNPSKQENYYIGKWLYPESGVKVYTTYTKNSYIETQIFCKKFILEFYKKPNTGNVAIYVNNKYITTIDTQLKNNEEESTLNLYKYEYDNGIEDFLIVTCICETNGMSPGSIYPICRGFDKDYNLTSVNMYGSTLEYQRINEDIYLKDNYEDSINRTIELLNEGYTIKGREKDNYESFELSERTEGSISKVEAYDFPLKLEKETITSVPVYSDYYIGVYKGTVTKEIKKYEYKQSYSGDITKVTENTILWKQVYDGLITRAKTPYNEISIVFVLDYNIALHTLYKTLMFKIEKILYSLYSSGISKVYVGLIFYGDDNVKSINFTNGKFTTNIEELNNVFNNLDDNYYINSNTFNAIEYCIDNYTFTTNKKVIITISDNVQKDESDYVNVQSKFISQNIIPCFITNLNDSDNKIFTEVANSCSGAVFNIYNYDRELITFLCTSCNINKVKVINKETVYHKIDNEVPDNDEDMLVGSLYIRHYTSLLSTMLEDTRTRGGGIEEMSDNIRRELQIESDYYYDIGYYDGTPYQQNMVLVIRIDRNILKTYGGRFTKEDVEAAVNKWCAVGTIPIIEYVIPKHNETSNIIDVLPDNDVIPKLDGNIIDI